MNTDNQRWKNFINITDKEKNDENLKSIYYLKLYAKNKLNNKTEIMNAGEFGVIILSPAIVYAIILGSAPKRHPVRN